VNCYVTFIFGENVGLSQNMDMECKKFAKDVRMLDKEMRAWDAYTGLEGCIKNMMSSLKAVGDLQNPSMRDRHWKQLMKATGVSFTHSKFPFYRWWRFYSTPLTPAVFVCLEDIHMKADI
jgi:hypothetical protein